MGLQSSPTKKGMPQWVKEFEYCHTERKRKERIGALNKFDERMMEVNSKPLPEPIRKQREKEVFKKKFKSAESAKRIEEFCETFKEIWLRMLDWRFGQLALEDDKMLEMLKEVITAYDKYTET